MPAPDYSTGTSLPVKLITVGRLRPEKGHERLIRALARCETPYQYDIIGDGPLRQQLETLIVDLGVSDKIRILGEIPMPYDHLVKADLFLQGSFYEGFPNAVIEANACGIPVAAWEAPGGHTEIIVQNVNGWIFASEAELMEILSREKFRSLDKHAIVDLTRSRYDLPQVVAKYEQHFYDVIEQSN
jgi:glycosyltransferase involved in cell wall biosynthesis